MTKQDELIKDILLMVKPKKELFKKVNITEFISVCQLKDLQILNSSFNYDLIKNNFDDASELNKNQTREILNPLIHEILNSRPGKHELLNKFFNHIFMKDVQKVDEIDLKFITKFPATLINLYEDKIIDIDFVKQAVLIQNYNINFQGKSDIVSFLRKHKILKEIQHQYVKNYLEDKNNTFNESMFCEIQTTFDFGKTNNGTKALELVKYNFHITWDFSNINYDMIRLDKRIGFGSLSKFVAMYKLFSEIEKQGKPIVLDKKKFQQEFQEMVDLLSVEERQQYSEIINKITVKPQTQARKIRL
jgi:hypothetical protein